jgi:hypothetical protein
MDVGQRKRLENALTYDAQLVAGRKALIDAAVALRAQKESLVLVGAQAIYLYTGASDVAVATTTKDSDIAVVPELLLGAPKLEDAMSNAGFELDRRGLQGQWISPGGVQVDLLVAEGDREPGSGQAPRGARIPPHSETVARNVRGIEGAAIDKRPMSIPALDPADQRTIQMNVAGPSALVVAKTWKICERIEQAERGGRDRTNDKDAHDLYRLLRGVAISEFVAGFDLLRASEPSREATEWAIRSLRRHGAGPDAPVCIQAGRNEEFVGEPDLVAESTAALIAELLERIGR